VGCTVQARTFRDVYPELTARGCTVVGVSTQRPDELRSFAKRNSIPFPMASDADLRLASAPRLPTFRVCGVDRLKRLTLLIDHSRVVRGVLYPIKDVVVSVRDTLRLVDRLAQARTPRRV
jgi:peroxiredoxin